MEVYGDQIAEWDCVMTCTYYSLLYLHTYYVTCKNFIPCLLYSNISLLVMLVCTREFY